MCPQIGSNEVGPYFFQLSIGIGKTLNFFSFIAKFSFCIQDLKVI